MGREFRLEGPPADSLLGFLSAVGLLMALGRARAGWRPRLAWRDLTAHRCLDADDSLTEGDVAEAAVDGISEFGRAMSFPFDDLKITLDRQSEIQRDPKIDPAVAAALGSDASSKKSGRDVKAEYTPLCMMFGSGHQHFLARLSTATNIGKGDHDGAASQVREALFSKWRYDDTEPKIAFRWDPTEYHPHALQATDPTKEKVGTVNGANRLAAVGFASCLCAPTRRGLSTALCDKDGVVWPIWDPPLSTAAVRIMVTHPALKKVLREDTERSALRELGAYGVSTVMKARLFWDDKFKNVSVAKPIAVEA